MPRTAEAPFLREESAFDCNMLLDTFLAGGSLLDLLRLELSQIATDAEIDSVKLAAKLTAKKCEDFQNLVTRGNRLLNQFADVMEYFMTTCLNRQITKEELENARVGSKRVLLDELESVLNQLDGLNDALFAIQAEALGGPEIALVAETTIIPQLATANKLTTMADFTFSAAKALFDGAISWASAIGLIAEVRRKGVE